MKLHRATNQATTSPTSSTSPHCRLTVGANHARAHLAHHALAIGSERDISRAGLVLVEFLQRAHMTAWALVVDRGGTMGRTVQRPLGLAYMSALGSTLAAALAALAGLTVADEVYAGHAASHLELSECG